MAVRTLAVFVVASLLTLPLAAAAQDYGDGFGIGGVLLPSGSPTILGVSRLGDAVALEVSLALDIASDDGDDSTQFGVGAGVRKYWYTERNIQPFFGGRAEIVHSSIDIGGQSNDHTLFGIVGFLGGEYFVARNVSIVGEVNVGLYFGSVELGTGSRLAAFLYL